MRFSKPVFSDAPRYFNAADDGWWLDVGNGVVRAHDALTWCKDNDIRCFIDDFHWGANNRFVKVIFFLREIDAELFILRFT